MRFNYYIKFLRSLGVTMVILTSCSLIAVGQALEPDCMALLKKTYAKLSGKSELLDGIFYMNYTIRINTDDHRSREDESPYTLTVKLYSNNEKSYLISEAIEVYQDQQYSLSIIRNEKLIYLSDYAGDDAKKNKIDQLSFMQDTLFELSVITSCETVDNTWLKNNRINLNDRYKKIVLELNSSGQELFKTKSLTFYINESNESIKRIIINYTESHRMDNMEVTFNEINYNYATNILNSETTSLALSSDQKLLPEYQDFTLVDTRMRNRKN